MLKRVIISGPRWVTYALIIVGLIAIGGWVKPFLEGPDLRFSTITRLKPVPVDVDRVKWMTKVETRIKRERVEVPVEVIREVPAKVEKRLEQDFKIKLPELGAEGKELVDVLEIPKAPHGGEMALTIHTATGKIDGIFRAKSAPFVEVGGLREVGLEYDPLNAAAIAYYRQDLVRIGPAIVNARAFASAPVAIGGGDATSSGDVGVAIGVAVRF